MVCQWCVGTALFAGFCCESALAFVTGKMRPFFRSTSLSFHLLSNWLAQLPRVQLTTWKEVCPLSLFLPLSLFPRIFSFSYFSTYLLPFLFPSFLTLPTLVPSFPSLCVFFVPFWSVSFSLFCFFFFVFLIFSVVCSSVPPLFIYPACGHVCF